MSLLSPIPATGLPQEAPPDVPEDVPGEVGAQLPQRTANERAAIERYFEISLYTLITVGFATLVTTGKLDAVSILFVGGALLFRGWLLLRRRTLLIPERWTTWFTLFYVVFYVADYVFLSASFVTATVHLVLFGMAVKVFAVQRERDHLYLAVLAFLEVLAAAVLTVDSIFLFCFCIFMLAAVTTFISMEMRRSAAVAAVLATRAGGGAVPRLRNGNGAARGPLASAPAFSARRWKLRWRQMPAALTATGFVLMVSILAGSALIFFLLPRVSAGYLGAFAPRNELVSGFSNDVNLGQIGVIQQSNAVVMHVTIEGSHGEALDLKWRGTALENFDGQRWTSSTSGSRLSRGLEGRFDLTRTMASWRRLQGEPEPRLERYRPLRYRVLMEPIGVNLFFLVPTPELLFGNYRGLWVDSNGTVSPDDRDRGITLYQALSNLEQPSAQELRQSGADYPPRIADFFLQKPTYLDARIPALAQRVTAQAATPYDKAVALERYLRTSFGYTLVLPQSPPPDPLAHFLFERKQGHCEYFASSMAVMLRTLGIPARIVNGFRGGEYNDVTGSYIVRARDAHSWVEAYFPGYGWVSFDPTPAGSTPQAEGWARLALYVDAMREFWREWIINYDFAHQTTLGTQAIHSTRQFSENARRWVRAQYLALVRRAERARREAAQSPARWLGGALAVLVLLLLAANARRLLRALAERRLRRAPERAPRAAAGLWYARMARLLARRGWRKQPAQSPREFLRVIEEPALRARVQTFTDSYERARFGGSAEDAKQLPELYEEVVGK